MWLEAQRMHYLQTSSSVNWASRRFTRSILTFAPFNKRSFLNAPSFNKNS
ncbi:hypothetical protein EGR_04304 [Echinococcus granulosus]|uniref:Uncharacterized protein n=1 Tax=Echinococcus granulosus TaxID=6210 RepID=W6UH16_ECHGR|nr:hypothetical protein EGR_04304 [Echinococcus granulosus]EUB60865.1 hypothetical protein EGR_04304 [Echinococcus granulosus]